MIKSLVTALVAAAAVAGATALTASATVPAAAATQETAQFAPDPGTNVVAHYCCGRRVFVVVRPVYVRTMYWRQRCGC